MENPRLLWAACYRAGLHSHWKSFLIRNCSFLFCSLCLLPLCLLLYSLRGDRLHPPTSWRQQESLLFLGLNKLFLSPHCRQQWGGRGNSWSCRRSCCTWCCTRRLCADQGAFAPSSLGLWHLYSVLVRTPFLTVYRIPTPLYGEGSSYSMQRASFG